MEARYEALRRATEEVAAVDAHAHNLVEHGSAFPFLRGFSEAEGDALALAPHSLSFKRSLRDIAALYNCEASLEKVEKFRSAEGLKSIGSKCFQAANISVILIDDGIAFDKMLDLESHKAFAPVVGRVLRIERLAETIINDESFSGSSWTLDSFTESYIAKLNSVSNQIVALKSIAAYRSGLEINPNVSKTDAEDGLRKELTGPRPFRITNKNLIDYLFTCTLGIAVSLNLPVQIHTGFGDKDLDLRKCNPLHLRAVLEDERFAKCQIVLLHASYPFSKEASYLASVYSQVYLDFGLAIPKLSVHGMTSSLKELLELAPIKKVMFSTDGYAFPETYYLGAKRARDVVYRVLSAACEDGDLSIQEAIEAVEDIFRRNALHLYKLNVVNGSINHETTIVADSVSLSSVEEDVLFVRIIWSDASGQYRCRVVPAGRFYEITRNKGVGLTFAAMGMTSFCDGPADGSNLTGVGEIRLVPDMPTLVRIPWREEMVMADMQIRPGECWEYCPRNAMRKVTKVLLDEFNVTMKAGFENEFFLRRKLVSDGVEQWVPYDNTNYCSTSAFDGASSILQEVYSSLKASGIVVEQLHAEAGKGQFEIALKYILCTLAADNLIYARETIKSIARKHGLLATFLPKMAQFHLLDPVYDETHRGRLVASGQNLPLLRSRVHGGFLEMQYDDRYTPYLSRAGLDVVSFQVRRGLPLFNSAGLTALVDRWRPETHTFHLAFGEMTVTLQDCQKMLGLRIRGRAVTGLCRSEGWRARVEAFLGREVGDQGDRTSGVHLSWLRAEFGQCPPDADDQTVQYYCRAWILHLFGSVLFPDGTGDTASWMWIPCLTDWDQAGQYSWGSAVLAFLYRQLCEACRRSSASASLGGCAYLLQLWMWSRLPVARPVMLAPRDWFPVHNARLQPTWAYLWDQVTVPHARMERAYKEYTDELDRLMASSVTWDPYADEAALPFVVSNICDSDSDLYRVRCPLICFYAVEYHLPHRVARQFGARQRSPPSPISTSVDLHKLDRKKNRKIFDWAHHHRDFIDMWNLFDGNVDTNNEAHTNIDYRRYQAWYHQATRPRLRLQWTQDDYADIESSEDEDTAYDTSTRTGRQVGAGPILDRVGNSLKMSVQEIERFRPRVRDDETRSFLDRLARRLRRTAARCGCRTGTTEDVYVPSAPRGGVGSSSHPPTGSRNHGTEEDDDEDDDDDDEDEDEDQGHEEIGPSQLDDAPWTQPTQPVGTRRRRPPDPYTPGTHALGHKGKGKSRRQ